MLFNSLLDPFCRFLVVMRGEKPECILSCESKRVFSVMFFSRKPWNLLKNLAKAMLSLRLMYTASFVNLEEKKKRNPWADTEMPWRSILQGSEHKLAPGFVNTEAISGDCQTQPLFVGPSSDAIEQISGMITSLWSFFSKTCCRHNRVCTGQKPQVLLGLHPQLSNKFTE